MNLSLNYEGFETYLTETGNLFDGVYYRFKFENGFGASVIKHGRSEGHEKDLWELGVLKYYNDDTCHLTYDTRIMSDIIGYLTDDDVKNILEDIRNL